MAKRALCVGINNYPGTDSDLNGCVNDAKAWAKLLSDRFDFPKANVKLLLDKQAKKAAIIDGLKDLLARAKSGDALVFTNSSHGTYVADRSGDEEKYDEALCPYDTDDRLIVDDELRELFAGLRRGVSLTVVSDSCHSGTVTRARVTRAGRPTPDERRVRFLHPSLIGRKALKSPTRAVNKSEAKHVESKMKDLLLSGCTANEYSFDARFGSKFHGAMTFFALQAIRDADYRITWAKLHSRLRKLIEENGYPQHPQLEGTSANKKKQIFG